MTEFNALTYSRFDPAKGSCNVNTDPRLIGLQDVSDGFIVLQESDSNKLKGTYSSTGNVNFETNTTTEFGSFTITGGEGIFTGATGTLSASAFNILPTEGQDPSTFTSQRSFNGSFQTPQAVPEPKTDATLVGMGVIGAGFLLRRRRPSSTITPCSPSD